MFNPYTLLTPEILTAMLKQPMYFVRQKYKRGAFLFDTEETTSVLLTHYARNDIDKERAERHIRLLMKDSTRFLYDSLHEEHLLKLKKAARQPKGYRVYINLLPKKWKASDGLKKKISNYMLHRLSWWQYSPADKLKVTLKERYGELYIALLWKGRKTEVHLDEIENFIPCATT
jgi:hypothetical protein